MTQETDGEERQQEENHVGQNGEPHGKIFAPFEVESFPAAVLQEENHVGQNGEPDGKIFAPFEVDSFPAADLQEENHVGQNGVPDGTIFAPFEVDSFPAVKDSVILPNNGSEENRPKSPSPPKHQKPNVVSLRQLFRFADKIDFLCIFFGTFCACAHGVGMPAIFLFFGSLVDTFVDGAKAVTFEGKIHWTEDRRRDFLDEMIRPKCIYFAVVGICVLIVAYGQVMFWLTTSHRQTNRIRLQYLQAVLRQDVGWFETHSIGEIGIRLTDDVNKIQAGIGDKIGGFIQYTTNFVVGLIIALVKGWKLALVILSTSPLLAACAALMMFLITASTKKESEAYAKAGAIAEEDLSAIRTVMAFDGEEKECKRYNANLKEAKSYGIKKSMVNGGGMGLTYIVIFCTYALAFWFGGRLTVPQSINDTTTSPQQMNLTAAQAMSNTNQPTTEYTIGKMIVVFFCAVYGAISLGNASPNIEFIATARGSAYSIWTIIDKKSEIDSLSDSGAKPETLTGNIEIKGATFHYPSRPDIQILNGLSVEIKRGQTVALVGSSGCGKSTVIQLIQRFYDPLEGAVMIDGTDIRQLNIKWLRQHIGVVSQEPVLFATTIAENIRYGRDGVSQAEIEMAAKEANAHDFISNLPLKYETLVGERGAQLSGGQKQRIAIARALVRDPKILLLDEATSALDTESEATVQAALDKARQGRTTVVVAHRLSTIKSADIIYGLRDGVVHESGTHNELMDLKGIYYELVTNQHVMEEEVDDDDYEDEGYSAEEDALKSVAGSLRKDSLQRRKSVASETTVTVPVTEIQTETNEKDKPSDVSMGRIMKLNASEWPFILIGCLFAVVHGGAQPLFGIVFGGFIGVYKVTDPDKMMSEIIFYALMFIVIGAPTGISMFFQFWMFGISGETLTMRIRKMTFRCLLRQDITYFDDPNNSVGAMTTRLAIEASAVQGATGFRLGMVLQAISCIGVGLAIGFIFSWKYTLFILGIVPIMLTAAAIQIKLAKGFSGKNNKELEQAGKVANEALNNIRTVASLTKERHFISEYDRLNAPIHRQNLKAAHLFGIVFAILQSMIYFAFAAVFYFGAWLIAYDGLEYDSMFKVFISIIFATVSFGAESQLAPDYGKAKMAAASILTLFDRKPSALSGVEEIRRVRLRSRASVDCFPNEGPKPDDCSGSVEFEDVHFSYPTRPTSAVLKGLSLKVEQGHTIALVGASGCGKSTTVQLLERFYDVPQGKVMIDGNDVKSVNVPWLRSQLGLVSQEPTLFGYSIRENIAYGDNSRQVNMDEIIAAARQANIHSFIETLPQGYETNVGDRGTQLSGGQKQRIAIARALVRNPKILLLDEATSALDTESEKIVQEALDKAQHGRTCLVIAHRLSTIQNANLIVVFHQGQVAEQGTHSELMAQKGLYYKLVLAQGHRR